MCQKHAATTAASGNRQMGAMADTVNQSIFTHAYTTAVSGRLIYKLRNTMEESIHTAAKPSNEQTRHNWPLCCMSGKQHRQNAQSVSSAVELLEL